MSEKPLVIYHKDCVDGHCAAWVARKALRMVHEISGKPVEDSVEYLPAQYGDPPPLPDAVRGRMVFILDFSWPREELVKLGRCCASMTVLDHHKTAQQDLIEPIPGVKCKFDMEKSGARLAWEHFFGDQQVPWLVRYVEDMDLWRFHVIDSKPVNAFIRSQPFDFAVWDTLSDWANSSSKWQRLVDEGNAILREQNKIIKTHVDNAGDSRIAGFVVPCVNATCLMSEIAGELAKGHPFAAVWFETCAGNRIYSLRSTEGGEDVAEIAKRFGGGGHAHAAGFRIRVSPVPLDELLKGALQ